MSTKQFKTILSGCCNPSLLLSHSRTIIAVNDGFCRLVGAPPPDNVIGQTLSALGFSLQSDESTVPLTWDALFFATVTEQEKTSRLSGCTYKRDDEGNESFTNDFWDHEDSTLSAVVDVKLERPISGYQSKNGGHRDSLRARMSMRALQLVTGLIYIVTFERPRLHGLSRELSQSENPLSNSDGVDSGSDAASSVIDREMQVHQKVSAAIPYFTALFDATGQALHFSASWYQNTGTTVEEVLGNGWFMSIHPDDKQAMMEAWRQVIAQGQGEWTWEARYRCTHGGYHWFLVRVQASRDEPEPDKVKYWYASMMDVHTLLESRRESDHRRESIMTVVSHTELCLWGLKRDRTLYLREGSLPWDPTVIPTRLSSSQKDPPSLEASSSVSRVAELIQRVLAGEVSAETLEHKDGDRWYRSTMIADSKGQLPNQSTEQKTQAVLGLTIDITDVRARGALELQNQSLVQSERAATESNALKTRFVANISHELRTPLAGIIGMNALLAESALNAEQALLSGYIDSSAAQLLTVINDVLDLSKIEAGRLEVENVPFRVCGLVEKIYRIMNFQAERKGLVFVCENINVPDALVIVGDPNRLQQILLNLLSNSIKFTAKGKVTMRISLLPTELTKESPSQRTETKCRSTCEALDRSRAVEIKFEVEDTGPGMSRATLDKLFDAFSQADSSTARQYDGTGLGLSITRQLVTMMDGTIHFESTLGLGTCSIVSIAFPEAGPNEQAIDLSISERSASLESMAKATTPANDQEEKPARKSGVASRVPNEATNVEKLVLIVEDNAINMKIASMIVVKLGYSIITAGNGKETLDVLETQVRAGKPMPDVILMDCMMPVMDGYETTQKLRQDTSRFPASLRTIPIVALTASAHKGDRERCLEAGMDDYLIKPINRKMLEQTLAQWTAGRG